MKYRSLLVIMVIVAGCLTGCEREEQPMASPSLAPLEPLRDGRGQGVPVIMGTTVSPATVGGEAVEDPWASFGFSSDNASAGDHAVGLPLVRDARRALASGNEDGAVQLLERAIQMDPGYRSAWEMLMGIYQGRGDQANIAETCVRMLSSLTLHSTEQARLAQQCALAQRAAGDLESAERLARMAVTSSGSRIEPLTTLTGILLEQQRYAEVVVLLEGSIHFPGSDLEASAFNNLGAAYAALGQYEQAEATYNLGLQINSRRTDLLLNLSDILRLTGRTDEMRQVLSRILEIDPGHQEAARRLDR